MPAEGKRRADCAPDGGKRTGEPRRLAQAASPRAAQLTSSALEPLSARRERGRKWGAGRAPSGPQPSPRVRLHLSRESPFAATRTNGASGAGIQTAAGSEAGSWPLLWIRSEAFAGSCGLWPSPWTPRRPGCSERWTERTAVSEPREGR